MNVNQACDQNLIDTIESVLPLPRTRKEIDKFYPSAHLLHDLAVQVGNFYHSFQIPKKYDWELRPSISAEFTTSDSLGLNYAQGAMHFDKNFNYTFNPRISGEMTRNVKKFLLYCTGLCIEDPLPYLLDFFRLDPDSEYAQSRFPAVRSLLIEYARLAELVRGGVLIPLSEAALPLNEVTILNEEEEKVLMGRLPNIKNPEMLAYIISQEQFRIRRLFHRADLFFPHPDYAAVLQEMLRLSQAKFSTKQVQEPFNLGILGTVSTIDPDLVSIEDIITIRKNEELFQEWTVFLNEIFQELYARKESYTDLEQEFTNVVREKLALWKEKLNTAKKKSSFIQNITQSPDKISIGIISGALGGLATGGTIEAALIGGAITGSLSPILELIRDLARVARDKPKMITLRHHFLALGASEDKV